MHYTILRALKSTLTDKRFVLRLAAQEVPVSGRLKYLLKSWQMLTKNQNNLSIVDGY